MITTCTRILEFDAGHRIIKHESKCKYLHGHRYKCEFTFAAEEIDSIGRVIDFGLIKERLANWIDNNLDHNVILSEEDRALGEDIAQITQQKIYYLKYNPTAENIARHLLLDICPNLFSDKDGAKCIKVKVYETPNCFAEVF